MPNKSLILLAIVALILMSAVKANGESGFSLVGEKSYWENQYAHINVSLHEVRTTQNIGGEEYYVVLMNFTWKAAPNTIDVGFAFPQLVSGGIDTGVFVSYEANETTFYDYEWTDRTGMINHYSYGGKEYYIIRGISVGEDELIMARLRIAKNSITSQVKYDLIAKLESDTVAEAISSGRYVILDPIVAPADCYASSTYPTYDCASIYDGVIGDYPHSWLGASGDTNPYVSLDLGQVFTIEQVNITNGPQPYGVGYGIKQFIGYNSTDSTDGQDGNWTNFTVIFQDACLTNYCEMLFNFSSGDEPIGRWFKFNTTKCDACDAAAISEIRFRNVSVAAGNVQFINISNNGTVDLFSGETVSWTGIIYNVSGSLLDNCWFANNDTGSFVNSTIFDCESEETYNLTANISLSETSYSTKNICGYFEANTTTGVQSASSMSCFDSELTTLNSLYNCSGEAGNTTLNFSTFNENAPASHLVSRVEVYFNIWQSIINQSLNYSFILNTSDSYAFCLEPNNVELLTSAYFKYETEDGYTHRYYFNNVTLTNTTTYINAYNFDTTTGITQLKPTLRDENTFLPLADIYTSLQKYYAGEGMWRTVQMDRSGEFGETSFNIIERTEDYRFLLRNYNNTLLKQTETAKIICTATPCELTILTGTEATTEEEVALGVTIDYNNSTRYMTISWTDPEGAADTVKIRVTKETMSQSILICDETVSGPTGSMNCNASLYTPPYLVQAITTASPPRFSYTQIVGTADATFQTLLGGTANSAFLSGLIVITAGVAGAASGVVVASALLIGSLIVVMYLSTLNYINIVLVAVIGLVTILIAAKIKGKQT